MAWYSQTWTWFDGEWREGNPGIMGPRTHAAWQALSAEERTQYRSRFAALEREHGEALRTAAKWLLEQRLG